MISNLFNFIKSYISRNSRLTFFRSFQNLPGFAFEDRCEYHCEIVQDNMVNDNCIWIGRTGCDRMLLNQRQVMDLLPLMHYFVEHGTLPEVDVHGEKTGPSVPELLTFTRE